MRTKRTVEDIGKELDHVLASSNRWDRRRKLAQTKLDKLDGKRRRLLAAMRDAAAVTAPKRAFNFGGGR